jgi:hypothetical protein
MEQVGEFISNRIDPEAFAIKLADLGKQFNTAFEVVEQNNHGILTLATLRNIYPMSSIYVDKSAESDSEEGHLFNLGYKTNPRTKPLMIGRLRTALAHNITIHSPILRSELSTFIEHENGKLAAQEGCHDDTVISSACAITGLNKAAMRVVVAPEPVSHYGRDMIFDNIMKELQSRRFGDWPIRAQDWN